VSDGSALLDRLAEIVGAANVVVDPELVAPYLEEPRGLFRGRAIAVARPGSTAEVAAVVSACAAAGVAIVPQGGNTGLVGGQIPDASGGELLLSLKRLNRIREVDVDADAMIVEAGVTLAEAQAACGDDDDAIVALRRAVQLNPSVTRQLDDPVLARLRQRDDFPR